MLRQLQTDLSPKFVSPSPPSSSLRCSRYGRTQRTKESMDFLDTNLALAVRRSIGDKSSPPTNEADPQITRQSRQLYRVKPSTTKSNEDTTYNVDLIRSPNNDRSRYLSPIEKLIEINKMAKGHTDSKGNSPNILGEDYVKTHRSTNVLSPKYTGRQIDFDQTTIASKSNTLDPDPKRDLPLVVKHSPAVSKKSVNSPRRPHIPPPPLFSESETTAPTNKSNPDAIVQQKSPVNHLTTGNFSPFVTMRKIDISLMTVTPLSSPKNSTPMKTPQIQTNSKSLEKSPDLVEVIESLSPLSTYKCSPNKSKLSLSQETVNTNSQLPLPAIDAVDINICSSPPEDGLQKVVTPVKGSQNAIISSPFEMISPKSPELKLNSPLQRTVPSERESGIIDSSPSPNIPSTSPAKSVCKVVSPITPPVKSMLSLHSSFPEIKKTSPTITPVKSKPNKLKLSLCKAVTPQVNKDSSLNDTSLNIDSTCEEIRKTETPLTTTETIQTPPNKNIEFSSKSIEIMQITEVSSPTITPVKIPDKLTISMSVSPKTLQLEASLPSPLKETPTKTKHNSPMQSKYVDMVNRLIDSSLFDIMQQTDDTPRKTPLNQYPSSPRKYASSKLPNGYLNLTRQRTPPQTKIPQDSTEKTKSKIDTLKPKQFNANPPLRKQSPEIVICSPKKIVSPSRKTTTSPNSSTIQSIPVVFKKPSPKSVRKPISAPTSPLHKPHQCPKLDDSVSPPAAEEAQTNSVDNEETHLSTQPNLKTYKNRRRLLSDISDVVLFEDSVDMLATLPELETAKDCIVDGPVGISVSETPSEEDVPVVATTLECLPAEECTQYNLMDALVNIKNDPHFGVLANSPIPDDDIPLQCEIELITDELPKFAAVEIQSMANGPSTVLNKSFDGDNSPSVSSADSAKGSSIVDEDPLGSTTTDNWQVGNLAWARIGNYPYWPCIICNSPEGTFISFSAGK